MALADDTAQVAESRLIDSVWYLTRNPDVRAASLDPVAHFCEYGWHENRAPNPWFDPSWYLEQNPDVAASGHNPLAHYIRHGETEGRGPAPHFHPSWYRRAHSLTSDMSPLGHYLAHSADYRFSPSARLYAARFLPQYRDSLSEQVDPYLRCVEDAANAGHDPAPDEAIVAESGLLDTNYYLINGADVREAALDPAEHFCRYGWRESRKPNIHFNTRWYLDTNPTVARLEINPLAHYICEGEAAGRRPAVYFDPAWYRATHSDALAATKSQPLAHYLANRRSQAFSPNPHFDVAWYVARYGAELGPNREPFAHYLQMGTTSDLDPSPRFDAAKYRRRHLGRMTRAFRQTLHPERDNPLVHYLRTQYD